eukprot:scaffold79976_cov72-Phaeocystis_antarctica.AAC.3
MFERRATIRSACSHLSITSPSSAAVGTSSYSGIRAHGLHKVPSYPCSFTQSSAVVAASSGTLRIVRRLGFNNSSSASSAHSASRLSTGSHWSCDRRHSRSMRRVSSLGRNRPRGLRFRFFARASWCSFRRPSYPLCQFSSLATTQSANRQRTHFCTVVMGHITAQCSQSSAGRLLSMLPPSEAARFARMRQNMRARQVAPSAR